MFDCPQCAAPLADDALVCNGCKWEPVPRAGGAKGPSEACLRAAAARRAYESSAPSSADLTPQQWYNVCRFYPKIATRAAAFSHRPLAHVGPDNPLDKHARPAFANLRIVRHRQPGEDDE